MLRTMGCNLNLSKEALEINPYKESYPKAKTSKKQSLTEQTDKCTRSSQSGHDTRAPRSQATTHATHDDDGTEKKKNERNERKADDPEDDPPTKHTQTHTRINKQTNNHAVCLSKPRRPNLLSPSLPPSPVRCGKSAYSGHWRRILSHVRGQVNETYLILSERTCFVRAKWG